MGIIGLVLSAIHCTFVLRVLTKTFDAQWLSEQSTSLIFAKVSIVLILLSYLGFISFFTKKLGNKTDIYIQILSYLGFLAILLHTLLLIKPSYYYLSIGSSFLNYARQGELTFIILFLVTTVLLRFSIFFLDKRGISLQLKIVIHTFVYFSVLVLVFGTYLEITNMRSSHEKTLKSNQQILEIVKSSINESGLDKAHNLSDTISKSTNSEVAVFFLNKEKVIVYDSEAKEEGRTYTYINDDYLQGKHRWEADYRRANREYSDLAVELDEGNGYLVVSSDYTKSNPLIYQITSSYGLIAIITFLMAMFTLTFARKNIISPIKRLIKASKNIAAGDFNTKVEVKGDDEFSTLSNTYNEMTEQINNQIRELKELDRLKDEFIAIVSHNLRTPLTTLRGYIEFMSYDKAGKLNRQQKFILSKAQDSTNTLLNLSEGLLSITALEGGKVKIEKKPFDVVNMLNQTIKELDFKVKDRELTLANNIDKETITIVGDEVKLKQAFVSVMENAIKFNKEKGTIEINKIVEQEENRAVFVIKDTGIGISKEKQKDAFKKFSRATGVYAYSYEGMGLGLHLTRLIVLAHGGNIWLESEEGKGTSVFISLPLGKKE